jgi:hypothetical protein
MVPLTVNFCCEQRGEKIKQRKSKTGMSLAGFIPAIYLKLKGKKYGLT